MARKVPAGSKLVFQMHYTPNGAAQQDRSYLGVKFADPKTVKQEVMVTSAVNFVFQIPPGADDFGVRSRYIFKKDATLLTLMPHMHLRGKAFRYDVTYPDGKNETILSVPQYDFGWQTNYRLAEPKLLPTGTRHGLHRRVRQFGPQPQQSRPEGHGRLRRSDVRGNDDRLLRNRRSAPGPDEAQGPSRNRCASRRASNSS